MRHVIVIHKRAPETETERLDCLQLARSKGIGPANYFALIERCGCASAAIEWLQEQTSGGYYASISIARRDVIKAEMDAIVGAGGRLLVAGEPAYPFRLKHIADPPPVVTLRGDITALQQPMIAIIGARNASANGMRFARKLAAALSNSGLSIVSGLARGIDTAAHQGAIAAGGVTLAAIASGADIAYPPENTGLMAQIIEQGAIVSEQPWGAVPKSQHFPKRNRIIAGLSIGVVVVEAALRSGSLITARLAADAGREVLAVPGSPTDERHRGTNRLLKDGAHLVEEPGDVLSVIGPLIDHYHVMAAEPAVPPAGGLMPKDRALIEPTPAPTKIAATRLVDRLLELLSPEPVVVDELIRQCHASPSAVLDCLLDLEMEGRVSRHAGNAVSLKSWVGDPLKIGV